MRKLHRESNPPYEFMLGTHIIAIQVCLCGFENYKAKKLQRFKIISYDSRTKTYELSSKNNYNHNKTITGVSFRNDNHSNARFRLAYKNERKRYYAQNT